MLSNKEISKLFDLLASLMEVAGENSFKIKSYSIAAFRINNLLSPLMEMTDAEIKKIENIGPAIIAKIDELKQTGSLSILNEYLASTPSGILELLQIKGLGAKKIRQLWLELEIESLGELAYACQENRLLALKGFGKKTQDSILKNIEFLLANKNKALYYEVLPFTNQLLSILQENFASSQFVIVGEVAQQLPIINTIHIITNNTLDSIQHYIQDVYDVVVIIENDNLKFELQGIPNIIISPSQQLIKDAFIFSGDVKFINWFSEKYTIPESAHTIEEIFTHNNLPQLPMSKWYEYYIDKEIEWNNPRIENKDIRSLIHCHSTWSDGSHSILQMAQSCIERGYEYMVITDHSVAAFYANGLNADRILQQHAEIDQLNIQLAPFKIYKGIEADILYSGDLDYNKDVWPLFDVIIASIHSNLRMDADKATNRILKVLDNPYVTMLGHPTGRLLLSREGYPVDIQKIIDKCAAKNVAIEINAHPRRLDLDWSWVNYALSKGVKLSINPDAHSIDGIDLTDCGVKVAQKTNLTAENNLSSYSLTSFETYLHKRKESLH